ncbi:MAG: hypothetical protein H6Q73_2656 [Firmicutes bacterium]|nr:hypothetical protein [Bacillota bacterium]
MRDLGQNVAMNDVLEHLKAVLPMIQQLFPLDVMFGVTDRESFLYYLPGKEVDVKLPVGAPIPEKAGFKKVLESGQPAFSNVPKEVYGVPFKSSSLPIKNADGTTIGVITLGISLVNQEMLSCTAQAMAASSEEISATIEEIAARATGLADLINILKTDGERMVKDLEKTNEIVEFIRRIAANSNLLGLNAAIEAARAGDNGRGFAVVANEIRNMAVSSASSTQDITKILMSIQTGIRELENKLASCAEQSELQAKATEQISIAAQQLASSATDIEKVSRLI